MNSLISWAPLLVILAALGYVGWSYIQHLYKLEGMRLFLHIEWTDGTSSRIEVNSHLEAHQLMNRLTFSWVKHAVVIRGSTVIGELNKLGTITWID